jgi:hypothetical protein
MSADLMAQLQAFALAHGGKVRAGPQPQKPITAREPSIGRTQPVQRLPNRDPYLEYTDDYSLWAKGR